MNTTLENNLLSSLEFSENLKKWQSKPFNMEEAEYPFADNKEEKEETVSDDSNEQPPADIVAYNESRSCFDLVRLAQEKQLEIAPDFQRGFVWKNPEQTRFIDSLIKGLPIPSLCLSFDFKLNKRQVIDGRQRIQTIINFLSQTDYQLSRLDDIDEDISGKSVFEIKRDKKVLYDRVVSTTIPVTVIRCDSTNPSHNRYLFKIFHRLNSGGVKLTNQEIRNCIYSGEFNTFLHKTVSIPEYITLMNVDTKIDSSTREPKYYRYAFEELNLRFFAFYDEFTVDKELKGYAGKLITFLNDYMELRKQKESKEGKDAINKEIQQKDIQFKEIIKIIHENIHSIPIHSQSKAMVEALFIGVSLNLESLKKINPANISSEMEAMWEKLRSDAAIKDTMQGGIAKKPNVVRRLNRAKDIFAGMA